MKKIVSFVLAVIFLMSVGLIANAAENTITANGFTIDVSTGYITRFDLYKYGTNKDIIIPSSIDGITVTGIKQSAFEGCLDDLEGSDMKLTEAEAAQKKIYVPNTITFLEMHAFYTGWLSIDPTVCCEKNSSVYKLVEQNTFVKLVGVDNVPVIELRTDSGNAEASTIGGFQGNIPSIDNVINETVIPEPEIEISATQSPTIVTSFGATVSDWAAPEIEAAFENNLIPEVMIGFDLTKKVNRGEFAAIAVQLYETLAKRSVEESPSCTFTDIQYDDNEKAIKKAYQLEVAQGTSATTYEPLSFINREQLATMLCRVIKKYSFPDWTFATDNEYYMQTDGVKLFADDNEISDWAKPSVYFMARYGIIKGVSDTHFAPQNFTSQQEASGYASATREQAIILAQRIFTQSDMFGN